MTVLDMLCGKLHVTSMMAGLDAFTLHIRIKGYFFRGVGALFGFVFVSSSNRYCNTLCSYSSSLGEM